MADVRCPMCGKTNPAEAESCRYCQARLKPLRPGGEDGAVFGNQMGDDGPDWLRELRSDSPPAETGGDAQPSDEQELAGLAVAHPFTGSG